MNARNVSCTRRTALAVPILAAVLLTSCGSSKKATGSTSTVADTTVSAALPDSTLPAATVPVAGADTTRLQWPTLAVGQKSDRVLVLQYLLSAHSIAVGTDGQFGPKTGVALRAFQKGQSLTETDTTNAETWDRLVLDVTAESPRSAIRALQVAIRLSGYKLAISGKLDKATIDGLAKVRADSGSPDSGPVTANNWLALIGVGD
jgi:peptidoglycan hydrolase-like protein with peptidoglycan-binding domain